MEWRLRSAAESDREFLYALHRTTMHEVIDNTWGWDDAWQRADFDRRFSACAVSIIDIQGRAAGGLWLESTPDSLHIVELQLVPDMQGKGVGSAVVQHIIQQGINRGLPVTLSVVPANPRAKRLYERLGFEVTGVEAPFIHMRHAIRTAG
jgi:ribosomal protein S18 acetylase RimI-like enzyme